MPPTLGLVLFEGVIGRPGGDVCRLELGFVALAIWLEVVARAFIIL